MNDMTYKAVLGYDDPENGLPVTRTIAAGNDVVHVYRAGLTIYEFLLEDMTGPARGVGSGEPAARLGAALHALDSLRLGLYEDDELIVKVGGEL